MIPICYAQDTIKVTNNSETKSRIIPVTFVIHGYEGLFNLEIIGWRPLQSEFEKHGFKCLIIHSPNTHSNTPNQERAKIILNALKNVKGDIILVGISNQGLFMPLVAAERPIRRIVMINACVPVPGKSFKEAFDFKQVFPKKGLRFLANSAPGISEVCPLKNLPKVEWLYICGEKDDAISPEWEQQIARKYLHVDPIVIKGAGHSNIIRGKYAVEVVNAAIKGL